ncbi:HPP family protein [Chitinophaga terrae (ex Kim and Jung 2007)]|uniref:HPP family protein n=1 Tax=Chitinophaga terrae (ex Kim and Jung 2007) TaxID=408074 RepID=A0A1H3XGE2_9BACT|nr:HPP family protein [Chitinophaga terrae (ex Kim and Jung 2007)]GEP89778.1 membrane protein [Chitinophaga terrae (ex Kim and Jung 2007)]SDZ97628.1 HPP family protein [Chitinophaga terrae (ex Kim and Jung 2007)]
MKHKIRRGIRVARYVVYRETLVDKQNIFWSFIGAFIGIAAVGLLSHYYLPAKDNLFLIGSFGASAVLIYGHTQSPLAQPRNLAGGHIISAIIGVTVRYLLPWPEWEWLACSLAVALSLIAMQITKTVHPPGGATALLAIAGSPAIRKLGFWYVLSPVASGVAILLLVAVIVNNLTSIRQYPDKGKWW